MMELKNFINSDDTALKAIRDAAVRGLDDVGGEIPAGEAGRDLAFKKLEIACGTLMAIRDWAEGRVGIAPPKEGET